MSRYRIASKGLRIMFVGELVALVSIPVMLILPFWGNLVVIVGGIIFMVGLYKAGEAHSDYRTVFTWKLLGILLSLLKIFLKNTLVALLLEIVGVALSCAACYFICTASAELLNEKEKYELAQRADKLYKIYIGCYIVSIVCTLLGLIPGLSEIVYVATIITALISLVVGILIVVFYNSASKALAD